MRKSFTINPLRTKEEITSYYYLFELNLYQGIEIFYPYNQKEEQYLAYTESIKKLLIKYPYLEVVMHLPHARENSLCENSNLNNAIKIMKDGIDYSKQFNVKKFTLHLGWVDKSKNRLSYFDNIVNILKDLCDYAKDMYVMVENMPSDYEFGYSPWELKEIFDSVNVDNIKFIFDFGHANCTPYGIGEYFNLLKSYLYHLHFSDNMGSCDEHKRMGLGNIDYYWVMKKLKEINYKELYTMEVIYHDVKELEDFSYDFDKYDK